jgi:oligopeptide/dipeptide ABC transporter ATP-binding protein
VSDVPAVTSVSSTGAPLEGATALSVRDLRVGFPTPTGLLLAVNGVSFTVGKGEVVGIVGESGSGKSMTCRAIMDLVPRPGAILAGEIVLNGRDVLALPSRERHRLRGREVAMVFQDPLSSLNPVFTVGHQIEEVLVRRLRMSRRRARARAVELLDRVGIPSPATRLRAYSYELSGGMRQRIMIAVALAAEPGLLIADEPTTALDVTIQDQILHLLLDIRREMGMSIVLVSHDMGVIAQTCDFVGVMYAGYLVEDGPVGEIFERPRHPYTRALLEAIPRLEVRRSATKLLTIPGQPPNLAELPAGCPFAPRCPLVRPACAGVAMELVEVAQRHRSACPFDAGPA